MDAFEFGVVCIVLGCVALVVREVLRRPVPVAPEKPILVPLGDRVAAYVDAPEVPDFFPEEWVA